MPPILGHRPATDPDHAPRTGDRARRARRGARQPQPAGRRGDRPRRRGRSARAGTRSTAARTPRSTRSPPAGDADLRGATLYVSLEPCCHEGQQPPCTDAILEAGIGRVVVASDDPTEKASGRGPGHPARRGRRGRRRGRRARRPRAPAEPGLPQARAHRAPVGAVQVGDDARRQGRDARPATRSGSPARTAALVAHRWRAAVRRGRRRHRHRAGRRPAADRAHRRRPPPAARASSSTPTRACRSTRKLVAAAHEVPLIVVVSRAAPRSNTDALENAGRRGHRRHRRERARPRALGARPARRARPPVTSMLLEGGPHLAGAFLDAGEIDEAAPLHRADAAGRRSGARPARGRGRRRASPTRCAR